MSRPPLSPPNDKKSRSGLQRVAAKDVRTSIPQAIAHELRRAIVEGRLAPGEPLRQDALAKHFEVSAIPVREALRRLETEGWITFSPNKGVQVSPMSADEAKEIYEIRAALESLAIGLAIPRHTPETLAVSAALLEKATDERAEARYVAHNEHFHMSLYAPAGRPHLMEMIENLHRRGERYLRLKFGLPSYKEQSDDEHAAIFKACRKGNVSRAQELLTRHLLSTGELLEAFLRERSTP
ncbi:GntR family transcriptional regulator [Pendulispora brunnea]|uniref:GntR family transcriptional regulator n=1 Tax=Pendulispora brunnea TaxID=2905690 RepID=A0ABZ2KJR8_9BACT